MYRYCPSCGAEYRAGFDRCADCDVALVDDAPDESAEGGSESPETDFDTGPLVEVYRTDRHHAELVRSFLEGNGIPAITSGEGYSSAYPLTVGAIGERRVLVREQDAHAARELIDQADGSTGADRESTEAGHTRTLFGSRLLLTGLALLLLVFVVCALGPVID